MLSCPTLLLIRYIGFSRQEYWNGLPSPSPGDLPDPGIEPMSPALACGFFTTEPPEKHQLVQFSCQSCVTLCDPVHYITPGLSVHHQLLELTQIHVHQVSDGIHLSLPLSFPSPPAFNLSQHQGLQFFVSCGQSIGVSASASVLPMNIQD